MAFGVRVRVLGMVGLILGAVTAASCSDDENTAPGTTAGGGGTASGGGIASGGGAATGGTGGSGGGAGGSGGTTSSHRFEVLFPPPIALTDEAMITVRGTAEPGTQAITIAGVSATGNGGLDVWSAEVPLAHGTQTLGVDVVDPDGVTTINAATLQIERNEFTFDPRWMAYDGSNNRAFTSHSFAVYEHDLATGQRRRASSGFVADPVGTGPDFAFWIRGMVWDATGNRLLVLDEDKLLSVDVTTGNRTLVADTSTGSGSWPNPTGDLVLDGSRVIIGATASLVAIDLANGDRTVLSSASVGTGDDLGNTVNGLVLDGANDRAFVGSTGGIHEVQLSTGDRTLVGLVLTGSAGLAGDLANDRLFVSMWNNVWEIDVTNGDIGVITSTGSGLTVLLPRGIRYDGSHVLAADGGLFGIISIDPTTGDRTIPSAPVLGAGDYRLSFFGLAARRDNANQLVVAISGSLPLGGGLPIIGVDLTTGARTILADHTMGTGPNFYVYDLEVFGDHALLAGYGGANEPAVLRLDLTTGDRVTISSDDDGLGNYFVDYPDDVTQNSNGTQIWTIVSHADTTATLYAVDPSTGARTIVSDDVTGTGPALAEACELIFAAPDLIAVTSQGVLRIDPSNGDRTLLSGTGVGTGSPLGPCIAAQVGESHLDSDGTLYIVQQGPRVVAVDLASGDRTEVSGGAVGKGPPGGPYSLAGDSAGRLWGVDYHYGVLAIDPVSGERVVFSK